MNHSILPGDPELAALTLGHLEAVVAIDSQSDESSSTIPTTPGQVILGDHVADVHRRLGATVERDGAANVIATYAARGLGVDKAPVALMVHLDTARGTAAIPRLTVTRAWAGGPVEFPANPGIVVDLATYPALAPFRGHDLVHGPGDSPFGLDDKLGLAHCLTLATLLAADPTIDRPPLIFVGRPDEEVGRHAAVVELAAQFAGRGVRWGYTIDGLWPHEINVENFNAAMASVLFPSAPARAIAGASGWSAKIGGVNTHGATAADEGHRAAPRLAAEWLRALDPADAAITSFESDARRDCDAVIGLRIAAGAAPRVRAALAAVMEPHLPRGASWSLEPDEGDGAAEDGAAEAMLRFVDAFLASDPGFTLAAEDSRGRDGYSQPMRARARAGGVGLDIRLRDFDDDGLARRIDHARAQAGALECAVVHQYVNMGPRLHAHPGVADAAAAAAVVAGVDAPRAPIRGGTGVDPFLEHDIPIANLGTGYFSPESEKELTSLQTMASHARWLVALVRELAARGPASSIDAGGE